MQSLELKDKKLLQIEVNKDTISTQSAKTEKLRIKVQNLEIR